MESESWLEWRAESHGLTWRVALPGDMPAIERIWKAKGKLVGNDSRPDLFAFPVVLTVVAEDERGRIVDGAFLECVVDITKLGASRRGFKSLMGISRFLAGFVASRKMRMVYAIMPFWISRKMAPLLEKHGFEERDVILSHWAHRIIP
ncbi:MAG: hypothetical protein ACLQLH_03475 [Terracidiphilus sp.]